MNLATKLASMGGLAIASLAAPRLTSAGWRAVTKHEPPSDEPGESHLFQVLAFAAVSAIVASLIQQLVARWATGWLKRNEEMISSTEPAAKRKR